ncbi:MAG: glycosyltransferase [Lentimonas sp.]
MRLAKFGPDLARALAASELPVRWLVADDGSSAAEKEQLQTLVKQFSAVFDSIELYECAQRFRKGGAIYQAWDRNSDVSAVAFVDADGAITAATVVEFLAAQMETQDAALVGVRKDTVDTPVNRPAGRALSFTLFTSLVRLLTGTHFKDTQCGLKVIPAAMYRKVSGRLKETGFVFDVELLVALKSNGVKILERPISWSEMPDGKVHPLKDAWGMLIGLLRVRKRLKAGQYQL